MRRPERRDGLVRRLDDVQLLDNEYVRGQRSERLPDRWQQLLGVDGGGHGRRSLTFQQKERKPSDIQSDAAADVFHLALLAQDCPSFTGTSAIGVPLNGRHDPAFVWR